MSPALLIFISSTLVGIGAVEIASALAISGTWVAHWRFADLLAQAQALRYPTRRQIMCGLGVWGAVLALLAAWPCRDPVIWPSLLGVLALVYYIPKWVLVYLLNRRRMLLRDQLVTACIALANTARAGVTLPRGLQDVSRETPMPLRAELREIVHAFLLGRTVHEAVGDVQKRLRIDTFDIFTAILLVCHERGGNLAIALDSLAHSLQENQRLERKLASETAIGRASLWVIGLVPVGFLGMYFLFDPFSTGLLFRSAIGQIFLVASGVLTFISVRWALWILNLEG